MRSWVAQVEKITILKKGGKAMQGQMAEHLEMEGELFPEFKEMRQAGKPVRRWWFVRGAKQILNEKNTDHKF